MRDVEQWWIDNYRDGKKLCHKCLSWSDPEVGFHKNSRTLDGYCSICKTCALANATTWRLNNQRRIRDNAFRARYGISHKKYDKLLKKQKGRCAICRDKPQDRLLDVDHNHETGEVRGLLCSPCNMALGLIKDDAKIAVRMAAYLEP